MTSSNYGANSPAQNKTSFYGRQTEIAWLADRLSHDQAVLAIYGPRYIGKSALLQHLALHPPYGYLGIYLDAAHIDGWDTSHLLSGLAAQVSGVIREKIGIDPELPQQDAFEQDPLAAWHAYVNAITWSLDGKQIVLAVDHAHRAPPEGITALLTAKMPTILAVDQSAQLVSRFPQGQPLPPSIQLGPLDNESAERMVKDLLAAKSPVDPWTIRRILEITSNHPHYIQQFCQHLLECCTLRTQIVPTDVEEALEQLLDTSIPEFERIWNAASPLQQALLAAFSALRGQGGISTQYDLEKACARWGKTIPLDQVVDTLEALAQQQSLEKLGTNSYRFQLELFRLWLRAHYPPEDLLRRRFWTPKHQDRSPSGFLDRWPLWASIGAILVVLVIVALQPALRNVFGRTLTPTSAVTAAMPTATPLPGTSVAANSTTSPTPGPTIALPGYDLLLMSRRTADDVWQIYALDSSTKRRLRLTETGSNERTPKWSPDDRRILFTSERDGNREVYIMNADGSGSVNLTQHPAHDWQPTWSPDGARVVFSSYRDENWEVYAINADGANLVRLTEHPESDFSPTWSPDGKHILFVSRRNGDADLFILDLDTRKLTQLTHSEMDEYDPAWSADGQWIAFTTLIGEQSDIFVMRVDGSAQTNLTNSRYANDFQPVWTQYSEELIFVSYTAADGNHNLLRVRRDGRELIRLTNDDYDNISPCWRYVGQ
ncbi:MAG: PD40 domain-containing protein [Anaerolineae bacterium]|nr:PD40 domain-containing protein [Anaerolineae bacterium]